MTAPAQSRPILAIYRALHALSFYLLATLALGVAAYTVACALGVAPWLDMTVSFGGVAYEGMGRVVQLIATLMLASLFFFMPAAERIMKLERSHRDFRLSMEDIARAYHASHQADRQGMFSMSSEFDQVRERMAFMRDHPDLERLEPEILEVAAQMSQQSRDLASVYSDEKVARAKAFLSQRQQEAETQQDRITQALHSLSEIRQWTQQVEVEEAIVASQLGRLEEQLDAALPPLGLRVVRSGNAATPMAEKQRPAAE